MVPIAAMLGVWLVSLVILWGTFLSTNKHKNYVNRDTIKSLDYQSLNLTNSVGIVISCIVL